MNYTDDIIDTHIEALLPEPGPGAKPLREQQNMAIHFKGTRNIGGINLSKQGISLTKILINTFFLNWKQGRMK